RLATVRSASPFVRVQIDMLPERCADLDRLMNETSMRTRRELFDQALTLFEWAVGESRQGRLIAAVEPAARGYQQVVMPSLIAARRSSRTRVTNAGHRGK